MRLPSKQVVGKRRGCRQCHRLSQSATCLLHVSAYYDHHQSMCTCRGPSPRLYGGPCRPLECPKRSGRSAHCKHNLESSHGAVGLAWGATAATHPDRAQLVVVHSQDPGGVHVRQAPCAPAHAAKPMAGQTIARSQQLVMWPDRPGPELSMVSMTGTRRGRVPGQLAFCAIEAVFQLLLATVRDYARCAVVRAARPTGGASPAPVWRTWRTATLSPSARTAQRTP